MKTIPKEYLHYTKYKEYKYNILLSAIFLSKNKYVYFKDIYTYILKDKLFYYDELFYFQIDKYNTYMNVNKSKIKHEKLYFIFYKIYVLYLSIIE